MFESGYSLNLDESLSKGKIGLWPYQQRKSRFAAALQLREEASGWGEAEGPEGKRCLCGTSQRLHLDHFLTEQATQKLDTNAQTTFLA
jgi:hypothetical protein